MSYGVKISRPGCDVMDPSVPKPKPKSTNDGISNEMLSVLALSYLFGAKLQILRYKEAVARLKVDPRATLDCLHEVSSLFEDLGTVDRYIELCSEKHLLRTNIRDIRNHIRHDLRDNLDQLSKKGRSGRTRKLGVSENLITDVEFMPQAIRVGKVKLTLQDIETYLVWAEKVFGKILKIAEEDGRAKGVHINL